MTETDMGNISDGYHTFNELYEHRYLLFINLAASNPKISFKTWLNKEKEKWNGWFILGLNTQFGQITYHLPEKYWDIANVTEIKSNFNFDGHNSNDVIERLKLLIS